MSRLKPIFVTGIGTGVGKTVASAILCEALKADYWKPIQAGDLDNSDTIHVKSLVSNKDSHFFAEAFQLPYPLSPHASARMAGIEIQKEEIGIPESENRLIIEGAGGLMVPFNFDTLYIDLIKSWDVEVVLVSRHYLGSINHTLLSAESLLTRNIPVKGIIFNGKENQDTEEVILKMTGLNMLGRIDEVKKVSKAFVKSQAENFSHL
ncbi:MAG: dethiobiotin synthase [Bacteroidia bacterium]